MLAPDAFALTSDVNPAFRVALLIGANLFGVATQLAANVAVVGRAPEINGRVVGSVQMLTAEPVTLDGHAQLSADLIVPGTPTVRVEGRANFLGVIDGSGAVEPSGYRVSLTGQAELRNVVRRSEPVSLPVVASPPPPSGSRRITLNAASDSAGNFATIRDLKVAGRAGRLAVPPGNYGKFSASGQTGFVLGVAGSSVPAIYAFEKLECDGASVIEVAGPVVVTIGQKANFHGVVGNATHPEWLELRLASGEIEFSGQASAAAVIVAPQGKLVLAGQSQLKGSVMVQRLSVGGAAVLELVGASTGNAPPSVELVSPVDGASFVAPAVIALSATAADVDGTVVLVEFFHLGVKFAESIAAPYNVTRTGLGEGTHTFFARATDNGGVTASSATVTVSVGPEVPVRALPFLADFEAGEGYPLGPLNGLKGWIASPPVLVTDADASSGNQSVLIPANAPPHHVSRTFEGIGGIVFVDGWTLPFAAAEVASAAALVVPDAARAAFVAGPGGGRFQVQAGSSWRNVGPAIEVDAEGFATDWLRTTFRIDYTRRRWDFHINGRMEAADLAFPLPAGAGFSVVEIAGQASAPTLLDDFYAGVVHPLFADADHDGMDDAWEAAHGLNPGANDRDSDLDADGLTNLQECIIGSDPSRVDSDDDGMPDAWEAAHGLSPVRSSANDDSDADGVTDLIEYLQGRNPTKGAVADQSGAVNLRLYQPR